MNPYLREQIQATQDLIDSEPSLIALERAGTFARTASGGMVRSDAPVTLSEVRRFFSATSGKERFFHDINGKSTEVSYVLVGMPDDDMEEDDIFRINGKIFRILYVAPENSEYETRAFVVSHDHA